MGWQGHLQLDYSSKAGRTIALDRHHGPQRVLQRLYPEGDAVCHHVLVHPPGGIVGGDLLELDATLTPGSHALITTPAATRFYRSAGPLAVQQVQASLADGARLEWLPQESIAYRRCLVENRLRFALAPRLGDVGHDIDLSGCRIAAPHDDEIGFAHLARIGAHFCADSGHPAGVNQRGADGRVLARITHDVAQAIDTVALHESHGAGVKERPHRCAPQTLRRARELLGDFVERGLPRQRCEFAALGAFALERLGKPFGMMDALGVARNFLADHARRVRVGGGAADTADMVAVEFLDF